MKIYIMYLKESYLNQVVTLPEDYETKEEAFKALCDLCEKYEHEGFERTYKQGFFHWFMNFKTGEVRGIFIIG